jgi:ABC-type multidrug transport system permease subunit
MGEMMEEDDRCKDQKEEILDVNEDDRVIANMNIEGMPWYTSSKPVYKKSEDSMEPLGKKETRNLIFSSMAAALFFGLIFIFVFFLIILFFTIIWR